MRLHPVSLGLIAAVANAVPAAVGVDRDGIGQVLLFPYYTVDQGNSTLLAVVNTSERAKALRVRVNEARNGQPVLWMNLYLATRQLERGAGCRWSNRRGAAACQ